MSGFVREIRDTIDTSLEMPEQYGSRSIWRFYQIRALIGLVALPILIGLSFVDGSSGVGRVAWIAGLVLITAATLFFVVCDRKVQRRIDETGSPLAVREPY